MIFSSKTSNTGYYDASTYAPFGYIGSTLYNGATSGQATFREFTTRVELPTSVKVGDVGVVGTENIYGLQSFKKDGISQGRIEVTYVVEPNTLNSAFINVISKIYDLTNTVTLVEQSRYLI